MKERIKNVIKFINVHFLYCLLPIFDGGRVFCMMDMFINCVTFKNICSGKVNRRNIACDKNSEYSKEREKEGKEF